MSVISIRFACLATAALVAAAPAAHATIIYDNLNASQDGSDPIFVSGPLAQSFNSGTGGVLNIVRVRLANDSASIVGAIEADLLADNGHAPGTLIASLGTFSSSNASTTTTTVAAFAPTAPVVLDYGATYWLQLTSSSPNALEWLWSQDTGATTVGLANTYVYASTTGVNPSSGWGAYQMTVDVPEPAPTTYLAATLLGLGLLRRVRRG